MYYDIVIAIWGTYKLQPNTMYLAYYFHKMEIIKERGQDGMAFKVQPHK
jgi:hypothetical protein